MTQEEINEIIKRREEWFRKNYTWFNNEVKKNITKSTGPMVQYHSDLIQIVVEQFLKKPLEVQKQMLDDNTVSNYLLVTCVRHLQSSSSPFYNQIRKHRMSSRSGALPEVSDEDDPGAHPFEQYDWYQCFKREMNTMSFYYRQLLIDKYQDGLTFEEIQKRYNITKNSLVNDIKNALQFLRCRCDNNCP